MAFTDRIKKLADRENYYLGIAVMFCVALRLLTPQIIGGGGDDAVEAWCMARRILFGEEYNIIHRTARFGTIIPVYLTQLLFGTHPLVYYIAPAIASVIQTLFLFKIAKLIKGPLFAFITVILYLSFPQMIREFSHPRVSVFSTMFLLISLYYALRFYISSTDKDPARPPKVSDLYISGICVFLLYLAKEDSLYFLPALMLIVYLSRRRFTDLIMFGIVPFSLFISETLIYHFFTEFTLGRLSVVTGKHFETVAPLPSWISLFDRFRGNNLRPYFRYPLIVSLIGGGCILIAKFREKKGRIDPIVFIIIALITYLFFLTFLVKSVHPVVPLNTFRTRYMNIVIPPMLLILTYLGFEIYSFFKKGNSDKDNGDLTWLYSKKSKIITAVIMTIYTIITAYLFFIVYKKEMYKGIKAGYYELHPFRLAVEYDRIVAENYYSGKPIAVRGVYEKMNRFIDAADTIEKWSAAGMTLEQACSKFGVRLVDYYTYKGEPRERITYRGALYLELVFLHYRDVYTNIGKFDYVKDNVYYRLVFNRQLVKRKDVRGLVQEIKSGRDIAIVKHPPIRITDRMK